MSKLTVGRWVTPEEVEANKSIGWYVNPGGGVYQVITLSPRKVKYIGKLKAAHKPLEEG